MKTHICIFGCGLPASRHPVEQPAHVIEGHGHRKVAVEYLCAPCARELGYVDEGGEA